MNAVYKSPSFLRDVKGIVGYIDEHNPTAAERFVARVDATCTRLAKQPKLGRIRNDLEVGVRGVVVGKYLLLYRIAEDGVEAVRLIHGSRDIAAAYAKPDGD